MKNTKEQQKRIDYFAAMAMQSLILINKKEFKKFNYKVITEKICHASIQIANHIVNQLDLHSNEQI